MTNTKEKNMTTITITLRAKGEVRTKNLIQVANAFAIYTDQAEEMILDTISFGTIYEREVLGHTIILTPNHNLGTTELHIH